MSDLPREERLHWLLQSAARLIDGGAEPVAGLVLPTGKFFPDHFERSEKGVGTLLKRVAKLAGLSDLRLKARVIVPETDPLGGGGCSSGACSTGGGGGAPQVGRVEARGDGWTVNVGKGEVGNATGLTTALVRAVSHIFLKEADLYRGVDKHEAEGVVDLTGVLLGFGVLLCNGAYMYSKG